MFEQVGSVAFVLAVCGLLFVAVRFANGGAGGMRRLLFGAQALERVGEVEAQPRMLQSIVLRVHRLGFRHGSAAVGLEVSARSFGAVQVMPVTLNYEQAATLVQLLQRAMDDSQTKGRGA